MKIFDNSGRDFFVVQLRTLEEFLIKTRLERIMKIHKSRRTGNVS